MLIRNKVKPGDTFGNWTVADGPLVRSKSYNWLAPCVCKCGRCQNVDISALLKGRTTCCRSCYHRSTRRIKVGDMYGSWTIVGMNETTSNVKWVCRCKCGAQREMGTTNLVNGRSRGCRQCANAKRVTDGSTRLWGHIASSGRRRGLDVQVDWDYAMSLLEKQKYRCALTGLTIVMPSTGDGKMSSERTASLDRIDSTKGYVVGNLQWVHRAVNRMKWETPQAEFIEFCRLVAAHSADYASD